MTLKTEEKLSLLACVLVFIALMLVLLSCGAPLLQEGTYDATFTVVESDWGAEPGHLFEQELHVKEKEGKYTVQVGDNTWRLKGKETDTHIILDYYQDRGDGIGDCEDFNHLHAELNPNDEGNKFKGTSDSEFHLCNLSPCLMPLPIPECEPREVSIFEIHSVDGKLQE